MTTEKPYWYKTNTYPTVSLYANNYVFPTLIYLVSFTIPFTRGINNFFIILLSFVWLLFIQKDWGKFKKVSLFFALFLPFYFWEIFSIIYSENVKVALFSVFEKRPYFLIFPLVFLSTKNNYFSLRNVLTAFVVGFLLLLSWSFIEILVVIYKNGEPLSYLFTYYTRWNLIDNTSLLYHTPYLGLHAAFCAAFVLLDREGIFSNILTKVVIITFIALAIYVFGAKLPIFLLALLFVLFIFHFLLKDLATFQGINTSILLIILLLGLAMYHGRETVITRLENLFAVEGLYWGSLPNRLLKFVKEGDIDRVQNWDSALCAAKKNPIIGVGTGDSLESLQACRDVNTWNYENNVNTHNQFLDVLVKLGIVGLALFCLSFAFCIKIANKHKNLLYLFFTISFIISSSTENMLERQKGIVYFTFINSVFLSFFYKKNILMKGSVLGLNEKILRSEAMIMRQLFTQPPHQPKSKFNAPNQTYTFLNPVSYLTARKHPHAYVQFSHILCDGWLLVLVLRLVGIHVRRYSLDMTSLAPVILNEAVGDNQSVFFIGAKPGIIEKFITVIKSHFPGLNIKGYQHGYFSSADEREAIILKIVASSPDIVVVGMGAPVQERFMTDLRNAGWRGTGFTCGGFIHQTAEKLHYYPNWINKFHLRMPYRFYKEPHFRKRIPDYFKFIFLFFKDYVFFLKSKQQNGFRP